MSLCDCTPYKVVDHAVVFVLSTTVISVKVDMFLFKAMMLKEEVQPTYNSVGTLTAISSFVCEKVYLTRNSLTIDTKHCALPWCQKVNWPRLQRIRGVVYLLSIVERVVDHYLLGVVWNAGRQRRRRKLSITGDKVGSNNRLALFTD